MCKQTCYSDNCNNEEPDYFAEPLKCFQCQETWNHLNQSIGFSDTGKISSLIKLTIFNLHAGGVSYYWRWRVVSVKTISFQFALNCPYSKFWPWISFITTFLNSRSMNAYLIEKNFVFPGSLELFFPCFESYLEKIFF